MEYLNSLFDCKINKPTAVTVGKFDGIHKGHGILTEGIRQQKARGLYSCMVTFGNSPRISLGKDLQPCLITNQERKIMLENEGIDYMVECPFDQRMMQTMPEDFIKLLIQNLNMKYMIAGSDFHFGYKGAGDVELLAKLSQKLGFELTVVDKVKILNRDISSTYIRDELSKGNIDLVNEMLGYDYFVWGQVVHGAHLGHKIGIPTINILPPTDKLVPRFGVYITTIEIEGRVYHGVTNVGNKPTVSNSKQVGIETNILDYTGDLYGQYVRVTFKKFLRAEQKFPSVEELTRQMNQDKASAAAYFNS